MPKKGQRTPLPERFFAKVKKTNGCWFWTASKNDQGYGTFMVWTDNKKTTVAAHRASWLIRFGTIPNKLWVLHKCDTPSCVRPSHLFLGTHAENMADMAAKGRSGAPRGDERKWAKLSYAKADLIRSKYATGKFFQKDLAVEFNVSRSLISNVVRPRGVLWIQ